MCVCVCSAYSNRCAAEDKAQEEHIRHKTHFATDQKKEKKKKKKEKKKEKVCVKEKTDTLG